MFYKESLISFFIALLGCCGVSFYWEFTFDDKKKVSSFLLILVFFAIYKIWERVNKQHSRRYFLFWYTFCLFFSICAVFGKYFDLEQNYRISRVFLTIILLSIAIFPLILKLIELVNNASKYAISNEITVPPKKFLWLCFGAVGIVWFLTYLAAFPGVYANDAHTWYMEFDNPDIPISAQWSPIYAGIFYFFVHTGYILSGLYEPGLACFSFLQMLLVLFGVYKILEYSIHEFQVLGGVITVLFFTLLPTHAIIAVQTAQAAPFMVFFALIFLHLIKMIENPVDYWSKKKNFPLFALLCLCACLFRNNGYYTLIGFLVFVLILAPKTTRKKLVFSLIFSLVLSTTYNNILLPSIGIRNPRAINEMLSLPLQQISCAYNRSNEKLTEEQRRTVIEYIGEDCLSYYRGNESIADWSKRRFDVSRFKNNKLEFIRLYLKIGLKCPDDYLYAFFMQNSSFLFIDKSYPDSRTWHPYLNYTSVEFTYGHNIKQISLFPFYSKYLVKLFGDTVYGFGGVSNASFSRIPFLGIGLRISTWFWISIFLTYWCIWHRSKKKLLLISLLLCFTLTIMLAPLVMYRYYAPAVFVMPIVIAYILKGQKE